MKNSWITSLSLTHSRSSSTLTSDLNTLDPSSFVSKWFKNWSSPTLRLILFHWWEKEYQNTLKNCSHRNQLRKIWKLRFNKNQRRRPLHRSLKKKRMLYSKLKQLYLHRPLMNSPNRDLKHCRDIWKQRDLQVLQARRKNLNKNWWRVLQI